MLRFILCSILFFSLFSSKAQHLSYVSDSTNVAFEGLYGTSILTDSSGYIILVDDWAAGPIAEKIDLDGNKVWRKRADWLSLGHQPIHASPTGFVTASRVVDLGNNDYGHSIFTFDSEGQFVTEHSEIFIYQQMIGIPFQDHSIALWGCSSSNNDSFTVKKYDTSLQKEWTSISARLNSPCIDNAYFPDSQNNLLAISPNDFVRKLSGVDGSNLWTYPLSNAFYPGIADMIELPVDGSYVFYVQEDSVGNKPQLNRITIDGNLVWAKELDKNLVLMGGKALANGPNSSFYIAGTIGSWQEEDMYLGQLDMDGNVLWDTLFEAVSPFLGPILENDDAGNIYLASNIQVRYDSVVPFAVKLNSLHQVEIFSDTFLQSTVFEVYGMEALANGDMLILGRANTAAEPNERKLAVHRFSSNNIPPPTSNALTGRVAKDLDTNCVLQALDEDLQGWLVEVRGDLNTYLLRTDSMGQFSLSTSFEDSLSISVRPPNSNWENCLDTVAMVFPMAIGSQVLLDFPVKPLVDCAELSTDISASLLRRCFDNNVVVKIENQGTMPSTNTEVQLILDPFVNFVNSTPAPTTQNGQILTYAIPSLGVSDFTYLQLIVNVSCDASLGQEHCFVALPSADNSCQMPSPSSTFCMNNIGSFDPNDKTAFVNGHVVTSDIEVGDGLEYLIRFQNTGTDTAFTVVVEDTISNNLNLNTLRLGASSHPYTFEAEGRLLRFTFDNILLPDSNVNEPLSHGFFKFKINQITGLQPLDEIDNFADIFFDFNDPIRTNTVSLMIPMPISTSELSAPLPLRIFPNPSSGNVQLDLSGFPASDYVLKVLDLSGRLVLEKEISNVNSSLSVILENGAYVFFLENEGGEKWSGQVTVLR